MRNAGAEDRSWRGSRQETVMEPGGWFGPNWAPMPLADNLQALRLAIQKGRNVLLEGLHGIGKSSLILALARELGVAHAYFNGPTLDPSVPCLSAPRSGS